MLCVFVCGRLVCCVFWNSEKRRHHSVVSATVGPGHVADGNDAIGGPAGRWRSRRSRRMARRRIEQRRSRRRSRIGFTGRPGRTGHDAVAAAAATAATPPTAAANLDARISGLFRRLFIRIQQRQGRPQRRVRRLRRQVIRKALRTIHLRR